MSPTATGIVLVVIIVLSLALAIGNAVLPDTGGGVAEDGNWRVSPQH